MKRLKYTKRHIPGRTKPAPHTESNVKKIQYGLGRDFLIAGGLHRVNCVACARPRHPRNGRNPGKQATHSPPRRDVMKVHVLPIITIILAGSAVQAQDGSGSMTTPVTNMNPAAWISPTGTTAPTMAAPPNTMAPMIAAPAGTMAPMMAAPADTMAPMMAAPATPWRR